MCISTADRDDDVLLDAHIAKLAAELAACQAMRGTRYRPPPADWHGHAVELRRISPNGLVTTLFRGSLTQCQHWYQRNVRRRNGRVWIEDVSEPALFGLVGGRYGRKVLCAVSAA